MPAGIDGKRTPCRSRLSCTGHSGSAVLQARPVLQKPQDKQTKMMNRNYKSEARKKARSTKGSILLIYLFLVAGFISVLMAVFSFGRVFILSHRHTRAVEAGCLAAAGDLSRIVINDPHFGFIALTDYPPVGKATLAADSEPLPVVGINTILGTARLDLILAEEIGSDDLISAAQEEAREAKRAARILNNALESSLNPRNSDYFFDLNGTRVEPYKHAMEVYKLNLRETPELDRADVRSMKLELGWLDGGGAKTNTPVPKPLRYARMGKSEEANYPAFVDAPVGSESFYFAGLTEQTSLVDSGLFRNADGKRICSVVKMTSSVDVHKTAARGQKQSDTPIEFAVINNACAESYYIQDSTPAPAMVVSFPDGLVPDIRCLRDILRDDRLAKNKVQALRATGGDYPADSGARLSTPPAELPTHIRMEFARGFLHWLRAAHCKVRVDSLMDALDKPFSPILDPNTERVRPFAYAFDTKGRVIATCPKTNPFREQAVYDGQVCVLAFDAVPVGNTTWTVRCRDQISELGTIAGGKHGGQPMPSVIPNWLDAPEEVDDTIPIDVLKAANPARPPDVACAVVPRSNYKTGRLAFEIEISSPRDASDQSI